MPVCDPLDTDKNALAWHRCKIWYATHPSRRENCVTCSQALRTELTRSRNVLWCFAPVWNRGHRETPETTNLDKMIRLSKSETYSPQTTAGKGSASENIEKTQKVSEDDRPESPTIPWNDRSCVWTPQKSRNMPFFRHKKRVFRTLFRKPYARSHPNGQKSTRKKGFFIDIIFWLCYTLKWKWRVLPTPAEPLKKSTHSV